MEALDEQERYAQGVLSRDLYLGTVAVSPDLPADDVPELAA